MADNGSRYTLLVAFFIPFFITSCAVGPDYDRPIVVVPPQFKEAKQQKWVKNKEWHPINPIDAQNKGEWWRVFNDPILNDLEAQLIAYNQNVGASEATYRQSLAFVDQARSGFFPTLTGAFSLFRQKQGGGTSSLINTSDGTTTTNVVTSGTTLARAPTTTNFSSVLYATWEPDVWGLVRRTIEASQATAQSNAALVAATRLSAQGSLAQYYFELRTLDLNQQLLNKTVTAYQNIVTFTQNQYTAGIVSQADVVLAKSQLDTAQAQVLNNGILRGQYEHAIAVLIGRPPAFLYLKSNPLKLKVPLIPLEIPSLWLERRPDVAAAERLVQNRSALIGVAVAAFYPSITLTGSATASARSLSKLINTPVLGWSTGLQIAETFFDGGYRSAGVRAARAAYDAQVALYRQTTLTAFQDVEDNLIALRLLKEQSRVQNRAAANAQLALKLITNQYKAGTVAFNNVIQSQILAFNAQKTANDINGLQMTAAVGLIKAMGGGWNI
ncbi:MAG: efflux transporter outer membrane subunit [bacterium]|nr:efflux transporter outer membrane subunit [bacterium]